MSYVPLMSVSHPTHPTSSKNLLVVYPAVLVSSSEVQIRRVVPDEGLVVLSVCVFLLCT